MLAIWVWLTFKYLSDSEITLRINLPDLIKLRCFFNWCLCCRLFTSCSLISSTIILFWLLLFLLLFWLLSSLNLLFFLLLPLLNILRYRISLFLFNSCRLLGIAS